MTHIIMVLLTLKRRKLYATAKKIPTIFFLLAIRTLIDGCYRRHRWWLSLHRQQIQSTSIKSPSLKWFFFSLLLFMACLLRLRKPSRLLYTACHGSKANAVCCVCVPIFPLAFNKNFIITRGILDANTQMPANNNNNRKYYLRAALWERRAAGAPPASPQQRPGPRHTCWMSKKKKYIRWATAAAPPTAITT